ncbi:MAG: elongation factor P maturation arginine rhamnosyltransferase EarP [Treponema sp.]|nr:elongation factor P maturation arginine rhamnosyltransferase EarP [Treponema sp.]
MEISVLCKVVDNFGDIGVSYRLSKNLKLFYPNHNINLIVSDLAAFKNINSLVDPSKSFQCIEGVDVYDWNASDFCKKVFSENDGAKLSIIIECFQCGRPEWLEDILFVQKLERTVNIIMLDYLTAEAYAEDFHCLQSLTRSAKVQKVNFMPGFTEKTGGLIIGKNWEEVPRYNENGNILIFTYSFDFAPVIKALGSCGKKIMIAQGIGKKSFMEAYSKSENKVLCDELPFMNQNEWDDMMKTCSALFIRGEESLSRACLSGIPFVWQAYPQSKNYHLVKMNALLEVMKPFFDKNHFEIINALWLDFNSYNPNEDNGENIFKHCKAFVENLVPLSEGFKTFALSLRKNGDLCHNLMTFIEKKYIINK